MTPSEQQEMVEEVLWWFCLVTVMAVVAITMVG